MGDEDEDVFYECVVCAGEMGRCRRSDGSSICKHNSCYVELRRRRAGGGGDVERTVLAPPAKAARTSCFKVREICIDMRVAADDRAKRAGCKADNDNIAYKVRGGFGADKDDELIPDTRWIKLSELVYNMDERALASLDKWAGKLQKAAREARESLRAEQEGEE